MLILSILSGVAGDQKPEDDTLTLIGKFETCEALGFSPDGVTYWPGISRLFISSAGTDYCVAPPGSVFEVTLEGVLLNHIVITTPVHEGEPYGYSITRASNGPKEGHFFLATCPYTTTIHVVEYDALWNYVGEFEFTGYLIPGDGIAYNHSTKNLAICEANHGVFEVTTSGEFVNFIPLPYNVNGITFNNKTKTYFGVQTFPQDEPKLLHEFDSTGRIIRTFNLSEFGILQPVGIGSGDGKIFIGDELDPDNTGGEIWIFKSPKKAKK